jgi:molecular chaperone GrpE
MSDTEARTEDGVLGPAQTSEPETAANGATAQSETSAEQSEVDLEPAPEPTVDPQAERDRYLELAQRTQADFENYRKRMARELESAQARGVTRLAKELLPALDNLDRALAAAQEAASVDQQLIDGLLLVQRELHAALERVGVERYGQPGEGFDPGLHEAVAHQPVDGAEPGAVVAIYQSGYRIAGAVIRPARVLVAA